MWSVGEQNNRASEEDFIELGARIKEYKLHFRAMTRDATGASAVYAEVQYLQSKYIGTL